MCSRLAPKLAADLPGVRNLLLRLLRVHLRARAGVNRHRRAALSASTSVAGRLQATSNATHVGIETEGVGVDGAERGGQRVGARHLGRRERQRCVRLTRRLRAAAHGLAAHAARRARSACATMRDALQLRWGRTWWCCPTCRRRCVRPGPGTPACCRKLPGKWALRASSGAGDSSQKAPLCQQRTRCAPFSAGRPLWM